MRFWKIFAWIALAWALVMRRGAGILIRKAAPKEGEGGPETEPPEQNSGPGWRRVSTTRPADRDREDSGPGQG